MCSWSRNGASATAVESPSPSGKGRRPCGSSCPAPPGTPSPSTEEGAAIGPHARASSLAAAIATHAPLHCLGVHDGVSLAAAERTGASAPCASGFALSASALDLPDSGLMKHDLSTRRARDHRGHPGAAGDREDPDSTGAGSAATTPRARARGGAGLKPPGPRRPSEEPRNRLRCRRQPGWRCAACRLDVDGLRGQPRYRGRTRTRRIAG
jgi:hypothetical protein